MGRAASRRHERRDRRDACPRGLANGPDMTTPAVVAITALIFLGSSIEDLVFNEIASTLGDVL